MKKEMTLRQQDLSTNPLPRVPVCLVLDASGSMTQIVAGETKRTGQTEHKDNESWHIVEGGTTLLDLLNDGVEYFLKELMDDDVASCSAEVSIVAFAGNAETIMDFGSLQRVQPPEIKEMSQDGTNIGAAVELALTELEKRKSEYRDAGVDYFQPWLVLMTDGKPTEDNYRSPAAEVTRLVLDKKLTVFPVGVGKGADLDVLSLFSPKRSPLRLKDLRFKEFFEWLSKSAAAVSRSKSSEIVPLDVDKVSGWGEA